MKQIIQVQSRVEVPNAERTVVSSSMTKTLNIYWMEELLQPKGLPFSREGVRVVSQPANHADYCSLRKTDLRILYSLLEFASAPIGKTTLDSPPRTDRHSCSTIQHIFVPSAFTALLHP